MVLLRVVLTVQCAFILKSAEAASENQFNRPPSKVNEGLWSPYFEDVVIEKETVDRDPRLPFQLRNVDFNDEENNALSTNHMYLNSNEAASRYKRIANYPSASSLPGSHNTYRSLYDCISNCPIDNIRYGELRALRKFKELLGKAAQTGGLSPMFPWAAKGSRDTGETYPGLNIWANVNLSGRREVPLYAEEPHYIIVRREDDYSPKTQREFSDDPFIPPRGRKHNPPTLSDILTYYDPFIPHRGRRDSIKDIFKHDDLFIPHRGKRDIRQDASSNKPQIETKPCNNDNRTPSHEPCQSGIDQHNLSSSSPSSIKNQSPSDNGNMSRRQAEMLKEDHGSAFSRK